MFNTGFTLKSGELLQQGGLSPARGARCRAGTSCAPGLSLLSPTSADTSSPSWLWTSCAVFSLLHPLIAPDVLMKLLPWPVVGIPIIADSSRVLGHHWAATRLPVAAALPKNNHKQRKGGNSASGTETAGLSPRGGNPHQGTGHCSPCYQPLSNTAPRAGLAFLAAKGQGKPGRGCRNAEFSLIQLI